MVYVTHGNSDGLARYLREQEGIDAEPLQGGFESGALRRKTGLPAGVEPLC